MLAQIIPTRVHGYIGYTLTSLIAAAPDIMGFKDSKRAALPPRVGGLTGALYTIFTDFELGLVRVIPMRVHLLLDATGGALLAGSPWLLGTVREGRRYWMPHVVLGTSEVALALTTKTEPDDKRTRRLGKPSRGARRRARDHRVPRALVEGGAKNIRMPLAKKLLPL
jgi:hypothetical protein